MSKSRFEVMKLIKNQIISELEEKFNPGDIISFKDINHMLKTNKIFSILPNSTRVKDVIKFLIDNNILIPFKHHISKNSSTTKYVFKEVLKYKTPISLRGSSYLSHYTALFLHGLTENVPKNIYTNKEQSPKETNKSSGLEQERIDAAFSKPMRRTNHIAEFKNFKAYLLAGKYTDKIGVIDIEIDDNKLPITDIERTLLDCTIRPGYCGGVEEVLEGYKYAKDNLSVNRLLAYLRKVDYIYPFHQAIGFYLERAGYDENQLKLVESMDINYKFYLTYNMDKPGFSERWQLYHPQHL
ncbi:MAG: type IV toxin-antitoxin system AbiEi family antitoxin domain-containing protein [bacterium]